MTTEAAHLGSTPISNELLVALGSGKLHRFADWPNLEIPIGRAGVYTVWDGDSFIYVGMAGRGMKLPTADGQNALVGEGTARPPGKAQLTCLRSQKRRSICIYVFDRLVLKTLSDADIAAAVEGTLSLDKATKAFIHDRLSYRYVYAQDGKSALVLEHQICQGALGQKPMLNPA